LINILIVSNLFPPDIGGPATYVPKIAAELAARGHGIAVVGGAPPEYRPVSRTTSGRTRCSASRGPALPAPTGRRRRHLVARRRRGGRLYVQGLAGPEMVAVLAGRLRRKPVALKIVGDKRWEYAIRKNLTADGIDAFQRRPYGLHLRAVRALVHGYARQVSRLVVPSDYLKGIVEGWGVPPARVRVIRNALTVSPLPPELRTAARREVRQPWG
jgi:glycosyltransferase involved in cell wall biosynthesis